MNLKKKFKQISKRLLRNTNPLKIWRNFFLCNKQIITVMKRVRFAEIVNFRSAVGGAMSSGLTLPATASQQTPSSMISTSTATSGGGQQPTAAAPPPYHVNLNSSQQTLLDSVMPPQPLAKVKKGVKRKADTTTPTTATTFDSHYTPGSGNESKKIATRRGSGRQVSLCFFLR